MTFKLHFSLKSVDGTSGEGKADDLESLEQNYTSTSKHISLIVIYLVKCKRMVIITVFCTVRKSQDYMFIPYLKLCCWSQRTNTIYGKVSQKSCTISTRNIQQNLSSITISTCAATSYQNNGINKYTCY